MHAQSNTPAPTVYAAAYALRNKLLAGHDTQECAGPLTFLITAWAVLQSRAARLAVTEQPQPTPPAPAAGFVTLRRVELFDELCAAVDYARSVAPSGPWYNAVVKAWEWLLEQESYEYNAETHTLRIESASEPGKVYSANGACQCPAHERNIPCYHRCAARLIHRALELRALTAEIAEEQDVTVERARPYAVRQLGELLSYAADVDTGAAASKAPALPPVAERRASLVARISAARATTLARAA